ncbi:MAG TPA: 3-hydroxyacyl-ACP dehydratase FabZ family protein [Candidatus Krumholzibacteria bacterium]
MRYILIDRIERIDHSRRLRAVKTVSRSEDFFADHFPGQPVMPGALLIECMAQAGTMLLEISRDLGVKALLVMVERAKFRAPVRPGDTLSIDVLVESSEEALARLRCTALVQGRVVADAVLTFSINDVEPFYPEAIRKLVHIGYADLMRDTIVGPIPDEP